ncbi:MAG: DNA translocase FtsK 4TM domain-containing protein, partial [Anaerolineales bacterium]
MAKKTTKKKARSKAKKTTRRSRRATPASSSRRDWEPQGLTFDQKLDIVGVLLALAGIVLILAFLSPSNSAFTGPILLALGQLFGLGRFLVPLGLLGLGAWIVIRHFGDRLPRIRPEQVVGLVLLYFALLTALHFLQFPESLDKTQEIARAGGGGGFIGGYLMEALVQGLDWVAAGVALAAWLFIALLLSVGMSTQELFAVVGRIWSRFRRPARPSKETQLPLPNLPPMAAGANGGEAVATGPMPSPESAPKAPPKASRRKPAQPQPEPEPLAVPEPPPPTYDRPIYIGGQQDWSIPEIDDVLDKGSETAASDDYDRQRTHMIEETLSSFGAPGRVVEVNRGPVITQFGVEPEYIVQRSGKRTKVKVNKIAALADDLALALAARSIRIEAPVPGKGFVGIEVPNTDVTVVALRDVMESTAFGKLKSPLAIALGQDVSGQAVCADLAAMPHLLIAGTTGSGKSVCVNAIITGLLMRNKP